MKILRPIPFIICIFASVLSLAQTSDRPPHGLVVIKLSLSRETNSPRPGVTLPEGAAATGRRGNPNQDPVDKMRGPSSVSPASTGEGKHSNPYVYVYSLKLRNDGEKNVRGVLWEFVAADLNSGTELNRRRFTSLAAISHGKTVTLRATSLSPPTTVVTTGGLGKDQLSQFRSSADIKCVLYADGTAWDANPGKADCAELRKAAAEARPPKANH